MSAPSPFFPHADAVLVGGRRLSVADVHRRLGPFLSDERRQRIEAVVAARAFGVVPVLEGLVDPGNVNAVLRSAEGLGYGAAHLVGLEGDAARVAELYLDGCDDVPEADRRATKRASQGAHKWVDLQAFPDAERYVRWVHDRGGRVVVTALREDALPIAEWDFTVPTALVVGNEHAGASEAMLALADAAVLLPLDGFVQSYNVSVAAALALAHARTDRLARQGHHADLTAAEREVLIGHYTARAVPLADRIVRARGV